MIDSTYWFSPIGLSMKVAVCSSIIVFVLGVCAGRFMSRRRFPGRTVLDTVLMLPLVLPPTVIGFVLLVAVGRRSFLGEWVERIFGDTIVFTWQAAVLAAVVMAFPLVYQTAKVGFFAIDPDLEDAARSSGASERQVLLYVTLPLSRPFLASAYVLGFARSLGEFGATLMVAGNIPGKTQTLPTAIYVAVDTGHMNMAWYWTAAIVCISFGLLFAMNRKNI